MSKILVTGGTGFIGAAFVERLQQVTSSITCLVRDPARASHLLDRGVKIVPGDVEHQDSLQAAVADADVVYHLAGATVVRSPDEFTRVNVAGTRNLADACAQGQTPPVLVFVSSLAVGGASPSTQGVSESDPPAPVSNYGRSKLAAEQALQGYADKVPITVLRPPIVFGPREPHLLGFFKVVKRFGLAIVPDNTLYHYSLIHVHDLSDAMLLAASVGQRLPAADALTDDAGQGCYYVADSQPVTFAELGQMIAAAVDRRRVRTLRVPFALCWASAAIQHGLRRLLGMRGSAVDLEKMREARAGSWVCRTERATRELGFHPRKDLQARCADTTAWYVENGWL